MARKGKNKKIIRDWISVNIWRMKKFYFKNNLTLNFSLYIYNHTIGQKNVPIRLLQFHKHIKDHLTYPIIVL